MEGLSNIFQIAEWSIGGQEKSIAFEQKLPAIFKAVEDLRLALGEKVTSIELEICVVSLDAPFDHRWMEDAYADGRKGNTKKSGESVAGTTGIGLKKVIPSPSGKERFENVLSPKVVLVSTLQEARRPPSPVPVRSSKKVRTRLEGEPEGKGRSSPSKDSKVILVSTLQKALHPPSPPPLRSNKGRRLSPPAKAPPPLKEASTITKKILSDSCSDTLGFAENLQTTAMDINNEQLLTEGNILDANKIPSGERHDLVFTNNRLRTHEERESLLAARAMIIVGTGAAPVMAVIDMILALRKEIAKVSNFLADNIRHASYELFQEELDHCYQNSDKIIGERLTKFLHEHSEAEELSQSLIIITIQIFITSFCACEWKHYLDTMLDAGE